MRSSVRRSVHGVLLGFALALFAAWSVAQTAPVHPAPSSYEDPALEARVLAIAEELRCLVCQNETIAASHADLAVDLRNQIREQMSKGQSDDQIRDYMTARYGDFVLYKPPFKPTTALLWVGPPMLLLSALAGLFLMLRARQRASPDAFDPDTPDESAELAEPTELAELSKSPDARTRR